MSDIGGELPKPDVGATKPKPIPAPERARPEVPNTRAEVLEAFNTTYWALQNTKEEGLSDQDKDYLKWTKNSVLKAKDGIGEQGKDTYTVKFQKDLGSADYYEQEEGIPVEGLIEFSEKQLKNLSEDPAKAKELTHAIAILKKNSKRYLDEPGRDNPAVLLARTRLEANLIHSDFRNTGDDKADWYKAESILGKKGDNGSVFGTRLELIIPSQAKEVVKDKDNKDEGTKEGTKETDDKKEKPGVEDPDKPTPAPGQDGKEPGTPPPAPTGDQTPKVSEVKFGMVAAQQRIEKTGAEGQKGMEVLEERAREIARLKMTEDREKWEGKLSVVKQFIPRLWKYSIGETGTYNKEKRHAVKLLAESGIQMTTIPYEFLKEVDQMARNNIHQNRKGLGKLTGAAKDLFHEVTFTEKDLHKERLNILKTLRQASSGSTDQAVQQFAQNNTALVGRFSSILSGDFQASESLAKKVSSEFADAVVNRGVGETKSQQAVEMQGEVKQYMVDTVIRPLLESGLTAGNGQVAPEALMKARMGMQELFFKPEFIKWYDAQPQDVKDSLKLSLSYGSDLIPMIQETILPQVLSMKEHLSSTANLTEYMNNLVLKVDVGTLEAGQKGVIQEGMLERATARSITNKRVLDLYQQIRSSGNAQAVVPDTYLNSAVGRADAIGALVGIGTSDVAIGVGSALGIYAIQRSLGWGSNLVAPVVGGSIVGGIFKGAQERRMYTREHEQQEIEDALGYTFPSDAKRRQELIQGKKLFGVELYGATGLHKKEMQRELVDPMRQLITEVKNGTANEAQVTKLMGLVAEKNARVALMDPRGIDLLRARDPQSYQVDRTNLDLAAAEAMAELNKFVGTNQALKTQLEQSLGFPATANVEAMIKDLQKTAEANLLDGTGLSAEHQKALGAGITAAESLKAREEAFLWARDLRTAGAATIAATGGVVGFGASQEGAALLARAFPVLQTLPVLGGIFKPGQTIVESMVGYNPNILKTGGMTKEVFSDFINKKPGTQGFTDKVFLHVDWHTGNDNNASFGSNERYASDGIGKPDVFEPAARNYPTPPMRVGIKDDGMPYIMMSGSETNQGTFSKLPQEVQDALKGWKIEEFVSEGANDRYNMQKRLTDAIQAAKQTGQNSHFVHGNLEGTVRPDGTSSMRLLQDHLEAQNIRYTQADGEHLWGKVKPQFEHLRQNAIVLEGKAEQLPNGPIIHVDQNNPANLALLARTTPNGTRIAEVIGRELIKNQWNVTGVPGVTPVDMTPSFAMRLTPPDLGPAEPPPGIPFIFNRRPLEAPETLEKTVPPPPPPPDEPEDKDTPKPPGPVPEGDEKDKKKKVTRPGEVTPEQEAELEESMEEVLQDVSQREKQGVKPETAPAETDTSKDFHDGLRTTVDGLPLNDERKKKLLQSVYELDMPENMKVDDALMIASEVWKVTTTKAGDELLSESPIIDPDLKASIESEVEALFGSVDASSQAAGNALLNVLAANKILAKRYQSFGAGDKRAVVLFMMRAIAVEGKSR